jgi:hypothetical protein
VFANKDDDKAAAKDYVESVTSTTTATTATKEKVKRKSYSTDGNCYFQTPLYRPKGSVLWTVFSIKDEHNYDMATAFTTFF